MDDSEKFDFSLEDTESPLFIPSVSLKYELNAGLEFNEWWVRMARWVNLKAPNVVCVKLGEDFSGMNFKVMFVTKELYLEFIKIFPEVLKGDDEK